MPLHELAGQPCPREKLLNVPRLVTSFYANEPDPDNPNHQVAFGTSGHRGSSLKQSFNEAHILAISQAICEYRLMEGIKGPLFVGMDTHALSEPALVSAVEVFAANGITLRIQSGLGYTPTPVISHAILTYNHDKIGGQGKTAGFADGVVITPSHNPPEDGGFKYNPPHGGPADGKVTTWIQNRANEIIQSGLKDVKRISFDKALKSETTQYYDFVRPYILDLKNVVDMELIAGSDLKIGVDPMGGSAVDFWAPIAEAYSLNLEIVNSTVDPTFSFMPLDKDGKIRMDCSSPYAMANLLKLKDQFDIAFGNDPDSDRHGIVTKSAGLMNPNHYLAVAISYLYRHRPNWKADIAVGKTLVSSAMIDRVVADLGKTLVEVPVGFKWFVEGLLTGALGFGGEESAGASFLRKNGQVWTTDKDGIILNLLSAEMTARTGRDPGEQYQALEEQFGRPFFERIDAPATREEKEKLKRLSVDAIQAKTLAGEMIQMKLTHAPGNQAALGGLKVVTENGWFAARPSGTEDVYKIYAESFQSLAHLKKIQEEAQDIVHAALRD